MLQIMTKHDTGLLSPIGSPEGDIGIVHVRQSFYPSIRSHSAIQNSETTGLIFLILGMNIDPYHGMMHIIVFLLKKVQNGLKQC